MNTLPRIPGPPKEPGWYWVYWSEEPRPMLRQWYAGIEWAHATHIEWHAGPIPEPSKADNAESPIENIANKFDLAADSKDWIRAEDYFIEMEEHAVECEKTITRLRGENYAKRARQVRESREGLSSLRTGTDDGDYIFDDNGYVASCRTASIASEFVEAVNQHGSLVRLREAVERFADTTKAWTWSSREEQELVNDIMQALRAAQKEGKL